MWFSQAEREPRRASSPVPGEQQRGRGPGRWGCGPAPRSPGRRCSVPAPSRALPPGRAEGRPARPGHRQFTAPGLRLPASVTITVCKALPADAHRADPAARCGRARSAAIGVPGPGITGHPTEGPRGPGPIVFQLRQLGGLPTHREVPTTRRLGPGPCPYGTSLTQGARGSRARVRRYGQGLCPREQRPAGRGIATVPASPGPAPLRHFLGRRPPRGKRNSVVFAALRARGWGTPLPGLLPPRPQSRPRRPKSPGVPQGAPEPPR